MRRFNLMVQHYGEHAQVIEADITHARAERALLENETLQRGYNERVGKVDGALVVFDADDTYKTRIWIQAYTPSQK